MILFNALTAYAVWFVLVVGAARGSTLFPAIIALGTLAIHIATAPEWRSEAVRILALSFLGTVFDTLLIHAGAYTPVGYNGVLCPFWITLLWANFATTWNLSLGWLQGRPVIAGTVGLVAAPISYGAAARLGAAQVHDPELLAYGVLAVAWAVLLAGLAAVAKARSVQVATVAVSAICVCATTSMAATRVVAGVPFAESLEIHGVKFRLQGAGVLRYRVVFQGYAAALYLAEGVHSSRVLEDVPKRLEIHYFWTIPADAFGKAAGELLEKNIPPEQLRAIRSRVDELHRAYETVQPGDRYALTYVPGIGTELTLNNVVKARIPGADFAAAYYAIWLGERPISSSLKQALLGR